MAFLGQRARILGGLLLLTAQIAFCTGLLFVFAGLPVGAVVRVPVGMQASVWLFNTDFCVSAVWVKV